LTTLDGDPPIYAAVMGITTAGVDPSRPVVPHGGPDEDLETVLRQNPHLPLLLRVSFSAAIVGHGTTGALRRYLPQSPPPLLARVAVCGAAEEAMFVADLDFLESLVGACSPQDEVIAAFLRRAALATGDRRGFLLAAARRLVPLLTNEPQRLVAILNRIRP
jgi:hypothetical protein